MNINRIFIADDHELVLLGLTRLLEGAFNINQMNAFSNTHDILNALETPDYDLYIIDLEFFNTSGFELIRLIRSKQPNARVIVCTMHEEIWTVKELFNYSVDGIVQKRSSSKYLVAAVREVLMGRTFLCPRFQEIKKRSSHCRRSFPSGAALFTPTEQKVAELIVKGFATKEIANILSVSTNTIETHRRNLFIKLDVKNVAQLVSVAIMNRLVDVE